MKRYGFVIGIQPKDIEEYKHIHANGWAGVNEQIRKCNITNYSIFLREPENLLFGYYEYTGTDHDADMEKMAQDPLTQKWWKLCMPMQEPLASRAEGEWWAEMESVFFLE